MHHLPRAFRRALPSPSRFGQAWTSSRILRPLSTESPSPPPSNPQRNPLTEIPLTEPLGGAVSAQHFSSSPASLRSPPAASTTTVTVLDNGLRVATEPGLGGRFCTVGLIVDSGSRYEVAYPSGVSHFLEKLAFGATEKFQNKDEIMNRLEKFGGICDCQSTRDTFLYAASVENRGLEAAIEILGDVSLRPQISEEEVEYSRVAVQFEIEDVEMRPDQDLLMMEAIHAAAFSNNTLGLPKLCPKDNMTVINRGIILKYLSQYHIPERMVLGAVGVEHDRLVEAAQKHFVDQKPAWQQQGTGRAPQPDKSISQYTGGFVSLQKDLSDVSLGPTPMPDLAHVAVGLESVSHQHPDFIPFCVLNMLMGGGGSFSAGGPGKGMYTRLYTNVLNRHHWMYSATAYNHAYSDGGVFCINASAPPANIGDLVEVISSEMVKLTGEIRREEFERAKKQLTSMLLMNLEARPVIFEDVVRQVLAQGKRKRPEHYIELIRAIEVKDINRVAERMLASKPAVAAIGNLERLPAYKDIELGLLDRMPKGRSKFNFFKG